jgi:programmed cell death 6-interacting protein
LEQLDDLIAHRATLVAEAKQINKNDDIRPKVLQEATKLAHGGSGDVKTEWFEGLFEESLRKYDEVKGDMDREVERQEGLLSQIRVSHPSRAI